MDVCLFWAFLHFKQASRCDEMNAIVTAVPLPEACAHTLTPTQIKHTIGIPIEKAQTDNFSFIFHVFPRFLVPGEAALAADLITARKSVRGGCASSQLDQIPITACCSFQHGHRTAHIPKSQKHPSLSAAVADSVP